MSFSIWSAVTMSTRNYKAAAMERTYRADRLPERTKATGPIFSRLMLKRLVHTGSTLRARSVEFKAGLAPGNWSARFWPLLAERRNCPR